MRKVNVFKTSTDEELKSWLMELNMSEPYSKYKDTIKAIEAELAKRSGVKKPRKPRKAQDFQIEQLVYSDDKVAAEMCENTTVKALNEFIKKTGWNIKRSLRKGKKIAAILNWRASFRAKTTAEKLEIINSGKFDKYSLLNLCNGDTLMEISNILNLPVTKSCGWFLSNEELISNILAA